MFKENSLMKTPALSLLAITALGLHALAQSPVGPGSVKLGKVQPAVVKTPEFNLTSGPVKRSKNADWLEVEVEYETTMNIPELTFKYTMQIEGKLLDGEVTYVAVAKDKEHFAVMYVSPKAIKELTGGKALTSGSIENVWVDALSQGQKLDPKTAQFKGGAPKNVAHVTGFVLRKDQTPFAPLFYDRYEEIKAAR